MFSPEPELEPDVAAEPPDPEVLVCVTVTTLFPPLSGGLVEDEAAATGVVPPSLTEEVGAALPPAVGVS